MRRLISVLSAWQRRVKARRVLAMIDARSLRDAGIDPGLADYEIAQPFWQPLLPLREPLPKAATPVANDCTPLVAVRPVRAIALSRQ